MNNLEEIFKHDNTLNNLENNFNEFASNLRGLINSMKMHEYDAFFNIFYSPENTDKEFKFILSELDYVIEKIDSKEITKELFVKIEWLKLQEKYLFSFKNIFFNNNIEHLKFIQLNILKPVKDYVYNINIFDFLIKLNSELSLLLYKNLKNFETFLKIAIVSVLIDNGISFDRASTLNINTLKKSDTFKKMKSNPEYDAKKNWLIFNEMSLSEVKNFLNNIKDDKLLETILLNILGFHKLNSLKNGIIPKNIKEVRTEIVNKLKVINELRNDVMHFDIILPEPGNNKLMECVKAMVEMSKSEDGAVDNYLKMHSEILLIISNFTTQVVDRQVLEYFRENILSYKIY